MDLKAPLGLGRSRDYSCSMMRLQRPVEEFEKVSKVHRTDCLIKSSVEMIS